MQIDTCSHPHDPPRHPHDCAACMSNMGGDSPAHAPCPCGSESTKIGQHIPCMQAAGMSEERIRMWRAIACRPR